MLDRSPLTTQFRNIIHSVAPRDTKEDAEFQNFSNAIEDLNLASDAEESNREFFKFDIALSRKKEELHDSIAKEEQRFFAANQKYENDLADLNEKIRMIGQNITEIEGKGLIDQVQLGAEETEATLEKVDADVQLKTDKETESCFRKYILCCCASNKVKNDEAKTALLGKNQRDIDSKDESSRVKVTNKVKQLSAQRVLLYQQRTQLVKPVPLHEELNTELARVEAQIMSARINHYSPLSTATMYQIVRAYAWCLKMKDKLTIAESAITNLTNFMEQFYCPEANKETAINLYANFKELGADQQEILINSNPSNELIRKLIPFSDATKDSAVAAVR